MHISRRRRVITGGGGVNKTPVMGLLERHGGKPHSTVRAKVVPNVRRETLHPIIRKNVAAGSSVYTDSMHAYRQLEPTYFHDFVDHVESYVKGAVHTNGLENFWSLLKRTIGGTYVSVDAPHLDRYVAEQAFRFNERKTNDAGRFASVMPKVVGKRLMYKTLIGANTPDNCKKDGADGGDLAN
jgi:transposase-like protein